MSKLRLSITMSLDGYVAGPEQSEENPLGVGGMELHEWFFPLQAFREMHGEEGGEVNASSCRGRGASERTSVPRSWAATCSGRFVVPGRMSPGGAGGARIPPTTIPCSCSPTTRVSRSRWRASTTFHFVSDGIESALTQAKDAARGRDVWLAGGASVVNQYLAARLVDEIDVSIAPLILGAGARLFEGLDRGMPKLKQIRAVDAPGVTHIKYEVS